jgi:hypothetical protein
VLTADGAVRHVISVGEGIVLDGRVVAVHGYMVDVTDSLERQVHTDAWQEASRVIEQRAVIERAKGALMVRYGLDADAAFELLRSWSSTRNEKLRDVAQHVVANLPSTGPEALAPRRGQSGGSGFCGAAPSLPSPSVGSSDGAMGSGTSGGS